MKSSNLNKFLWSHSNSLGWIHACLLRQSEGDNSSCPTLNVTSKNKDLLLHISPQVSFLSTHRLKKRHPYKHTSDPYVNSFHRNSHFQILIQNIYLSPGEGVAFAPPPWGTSKLSLPLVQQKDPTSSQPGKVLQGVNEALEEPLFIHSIAGLDPILVHLSPSHVNITLLGCKCNTTLQSQVIQASYEVKTLVILHLTVHFVYY